MALSDSINGLSKPTPSYGNDPNHPGHLGDHFEAMKTADARIESNLNVPNMPIIYGQGISQKVGPFEVEQPGKPLIPKPGNTNKSMKGIGGR